MRLGMGWGMGMRSEGGGEGALREKTAPESYAGPFRHTQGSPLSAKPYC